ncbi:MAG: asparagine synthase (glutamine-hydrolyzing) [Ruminococcaceae bacterium]|nr:asparagine synthase (glutamine-hydrolyzing) [Oscillospiraceae bacterium]
MCGFIGFTGIIDKREDVIHKMADRIIHRGPDSDGYHLSGESPFDSITLGFRRLSIIDLEDGSQPMYNEDGSIVIVYNGEVYNFMELRDELIAKGHVFKTRCDTETLVHGYEEWGTSLASRLRGMFAFVIWDTNSNTLYGARDPFGIKPFYYYNTESGNVIFGSEIKSFLEHPEFKPEVNERALRPYLTFQYSSMEETFFKNTYKLPPAHWFTLKDGRMTKERYWDVDFGKKHTLSYDECAEQIDARVHESVNAHRISDVKVGAFLSGGVDSSYITATLMPNDTFSVGFEQKNFDETGEAKELSERLGVQNYLKHITADECFGAFPTIQYHMDEPQSNPSSVPLYFLSQLAREHVTVVLSGEGADEIYAGYEWYDETPMMQKYKKIPGFLRRGLANIAEKMPYFKGHDFIIKGSGVPENYFIGQALVFPEDEAEAILKDKYKVGPTAREVTRPVYDRVKDLSELEKKQYLDLNLWLPGDILLKADKMSMAHSLELRVPYLDKVVMSEAQEIPAKYKIDGNDTKAVLRTAANKTLPDEWAHRPKKGFPVPIRTWLREDKYYNIVKEAFTSEIAEEYFDTSALLKLLDDHKNGSANNQRKIWTVYTFLVWHKQFIA